MKKDNIYLQPNLIDKMLLTLTNNSRKILRKAGYSVNKEDDEFEVEFEFYDGVAYDTAGKGIKLVYHTIDKVKSSKTMLQTICDYCGRDEVTQYDIALKYGKVTLADDNEKFVKMQSDYYYRIIENVVQLSADLYETIYSLHGVENYTTATGIIKRLAEEFEEEWINDEKENKDSDYIYKLEEFEERKLKEIKKIYGSD
jgi:hypothetical protein